MKETQALGIGLILINFAFILHLVLLHFD